ncbi:MAG: hypothetical protein KDD50_08555 [Bdellovibrionales bacterium]|nr:hypothetical protein [Bdellovibrionales bacterium]
MNNLIKIKRFTFALFIVVFLSFFQNCSPVKFESTHVGKSSSVTPLDTVLGPDGENDGIELPNKNADLNVGLIEGEEDYGLFEDLPINPDERVNILRGICSRVVSMSDRIVRRRDGGVLTNFSGHYLFKVNQLDEISNGSGHMILLGIENNASIKKIDNFSGSIISCGVSVETLSNTSGNILLKDADVGNITNRSGSMVLLGGEIKGDVTNSSGKLLEIPDLFSISYHNF